MSSVADIVRRIRMAIVATGMALVCAGVCAATETPSAKPAAAKPAASASGKAAVEAKAADLKVTRKVVEGMLVHAGKRSISVEIESTETTATDMLLPLADAVEVRGVKSVAELKRGDRVKVGVEQSYRMGADGEPVLVKTQALVIVLLPPTEAAPAEAAP